MPIPIRTKTRRPSLATRGAEAMEDHYSAVPAYFVTGQGGA